MTETALTLLSAPAILALVNLAKGVGLPGRWAALAAVVLGVGVACLERYAPVDVVQTVTGGLIVGLGAAGLYDVAKIGSPPPVRVGSPKRAL